MADAYKVLRERQNKAKALIAQLTRSLKHVPTTRESEVLRFVKLAHRITGKIPAQVTIAKHFQFSRERARQLMGRLRDKGFIAEFEPATRANGKGKGK